MLKRNELTAVLSIPFALAPRILAALILATLAVAVLPLAVVTLAVATVAALAVLVWREIVPPHRAAANYAALAELWSAMEAFDHRSRRDFNRLLNGGTLAEFFGETPRPVSRRAPVPAAVEQTVETPVASAAAPAPAPVPLVLSVRTLPLLAYRPAPVLTVDAVRILSRQSIPVAPSLATVLGIDAYPTDAYDVETLPVVAALPVLPTTKRTRKPAAPRKPRVVATPKVKPAPAPKPTVKHSRRTAPLDAALEVIATAKRIRTMPSAARHTAPAASMADVLSVATMPADAFQVEPLPYGTAPLPGAPAPTAKPKRVRKTSKPALPEVLASVRPFQPAQLIAHLARESKGRFDYVETARQHGIGTDGKFAFVLPDALKAKLPQEPTAGRPIGSHLLKEVLATKHRDGAATVTGLREGIDGGPQGCYVTHGTCVVTVTAKHAATALKLFPGATLHLSTKRQPTDGPVIVRHDGKTVGALMPWVK